MTTFNRGDRFTLGNGVTGSVTDTWLAFSRRIAQVQFDGNVSTQGAKYNNNFNADWLEEHAEKIEPPLPLATDILPTLKPGDRITVTNAGGHDVPGLAYDEYLTYVAAPELRSEYVGYVWVISSHSPREAHRVTISKTDHIKVHPKED